MTYDASDTRKDRTVCKHGLPVRSKCETCGGDGYLGKPPPELDGTIAAVIEDCPDCDDCESEAS